MKVYILVGIDGEGRQVLGAYSTIDQAREQRDYCIEELADFDDYICICRGVNAEADMPFGHTVETF